MRTLAIGDLHGCSRALDALLELVDPTRDDELVLLGDYVDRGPDSRGVLDRVIALQQTHRVVALLGNHDQMMLDARGDPGSDWPTGYGLNTLQSYACSSAPAALEQVPAAHWRLLESCAELHETAAHIFVHANLYPDVDLAEQPTFMTRWEQLDPDASRPHCSGKTMICGHTSQKSGLPLDLGHAVCIDTYAHGGGWLTCLEPATGKVWQARQDGRVRAGWLGALDELS